MQKFIKASILKFFLLHCFVFSFLSTTWAHKFYFAFAEVEYNENSSKLEATLTVTAHDFEEYMKKFGAIEGSLDSAFLDTARLKLIEKEINKHFAFRNDLKSDQPTKMNSDFSIEGYHILMNGNLEIYMSCDVLKPEYVLSVNFDLLMNEFPDQQNKLTFIHKGSKKTLNFTSNNPIQLIDLK